MAFLRIYVGDTLLQQQELNAARTRIGRGADNDIVLNGRGVSKHHAVIEKQGESYVLIDNDSANGVFVGGKRVRHHVLKYWDEIQVFNFVIKFMGVQRLKGEETGLPVNSGRPAQDKTMEVDISSIGDLARLRRRIRIPAIALLDHGQEQTCLRLDKVNFTIGKSRDCDLQTRGWFSPRLAASIQRRNDGCYLMPARRGRVSVNGQRVRGQTMLQDGDRLQVHDLALTFSLQPVGGR